MSDNKYNYPHFERDKVVPTFGKFIDDGPKAGEQAPEFSLEDLETGEMVPLKSLWNQGLTVFEFGSYA